MIKADVNSLRSGNGPFDVLVLAGDRPGSTELLKSAGVSGKALIPLGGVPLLERVLTAVVQWEQLRSIVLVAPERAEYQTVVRRCVPSGAITWVSPGPTLFESIEASMRLTGHWDTAGVIVSADHGLVRPTWLDQVTSGLGQGEGLAIGMADWHQVMGAYPNNHRTRYRFSNRSVCGGNLFAFHREALDKVLGVWSSVEQQRKKPWRMLSMLGYGSVIGYLLGRLSMEDAFAKLSRLTQTSVVPVMMEDPSVAVDIDSVADWLLAERILVERQHQSQGVEPC